MTEIKVFGKPRAEVIKIFKESFQKLNIDIPEIYLAFFRSEKELKIYREGFGRISAKLLSKRGKKIFESSVKTEFHSMASIFMPKRRRKESTPSVILINLSSQIPEIDWEIAIFHEALHLKNETMGWMQIEEKVIIEALHDFCIGIEDVHVLQIIYDCIADFFGDEIASQYHCSDYVLRHKEIFIYNTIKTLKKLSEERAKSKSIQDIEIIETLIRSAFAINLPPSYAPSYANREKHQKLLESEFSPALSLIPEYIDFQKLASLPSRIKVPPGRINLLNIYGKIFGIYNDLLNHFLNL